MDLLLIVALVLGAAVWLVALYRWQYALYGLFIYIPVSGALQLLFPSHVWMVLVKDFVFVLPAYLSFCLTLRGRKSVFPLSLTAAMIALAIIVLVQLFNPAGLPLLAGLIGVK